MTTPKKTYHDYVIKDGKFIGKFEDMYRHFEDPWMQSQQPNRYSRQVAIMNMKRYGIRSVVEYGCGLGYYADWIHRETGIVCQSIDISKTAIKKAKAKFPHLDFHVGNIRDMGSLKNKAHIDCILLADITWMILQDLDYVNTELLKHFRGKYLINNFVTYKGTQKYGLDFFTTTQEYIDYMPFKLIGYAEGTTIDDHNIDSTTIFKIEPKQV
ncbi:MAG: methyltransferase domain-containing protein [Bacteroidetes bacterium]|nr:methyltransferase domain-containing protein [Bacteroidota bacterium]